MHVLMMPIFHITNFVDRPFFFRPIHAIVSRMVNVFAGLRLVAFSTDIAKVCTERSQVIWEEAIKRGIPMQQMILWGKPLEQYRAKVYGRWQYFSSLPIPAHEDRTAYMWMDNKVTLKKFFMERGVKVPYGGRAATLSQAEDIFAKAQKPVITKPEIGSRGRHTTTHLYTLADLRRGLSIAQRLCQFVVVEEHLAGSVYRATYVGGNVVGILRGDPPRITGDGVRTIAELIEKKNAEKPEMVDDVRITDLTHEFLARQGYVLGSILEPEKTVDLHEKIGLSYGGDAIEEIVITHPKLLAELKKAGDVLGAPVVGFDFISEDITKDPDEVRWGIIEANSMPFINLHHFPRTGEPVNVAGKVWDLWNR